MTPESLLARVAGRGFRVEVGDDGPTLVRVSGSKALPAQLLADLRVNRDAVVRHLAAAAVLARAGERSVWGYDSADGRAARLKGRVPPAGWDRMCVEGDAEWTELPRAEE